MTPYVAAIQAATGYSVTLIETTLETAVKGIVPLKYPGSHEWDVWICYLALRAYEQDEVNRSNHD